MCGVITYQLTIHSLLFERNITIQKKNEPINQTLFMISCPGRGREQQLDQFLWFVTLGCSNPLYLKSQLKSFEPHPPNDQEHRTNDSPPLSKPPK
jgi:hypothetical protein